MDDVKHFTQMSYSSDSIPLEICTQNDKFNADTERAVESFPTPDDRKSPMDTHECMFRKIYMMTNKKLLVEMLLRLDVLIKKSRLLKS